MPIVAKARRGLVLSPRRREPTVAETALLASAPNTFIIGAPKCGTTALSIYLKSHPNIFVVPVKEPQFWSFDITEAETYGLTSIDDYLAMFHTAKHDHHIRIDASTNYLWSHVAVPEILNTFPDSRFIVMLRNPVDLAYGYYMEERYWLHEDLPSFEEAWDALPDRRAGRRVPKLCPDPQKLDYERIASIGTQLQAVMKHFSRGKLLVLFLEDLSSSARDVYSQTLSFLGVPDDGRLDFPRINQAKEMSNTFVSNLLLYPPAPVHAVMKATRNALWTLGIRGLRTRLYQGINQTRDRQPLSPSFRKMLTLRFTEEIHTVSKLTGKDLSHWISPSE